MKQKRTHQSYVDCGLNGARAKWDKIPLQERFWPKVDKAEPNSCWNWNRKPAATGYGKCHMVGEWGAHRVAYKLTHGSIPKGMHIIHSCDNRLCCNPAHLRAGTMKDNMGDMVLRNRQYRPTGDKHHNKKLDSQKVIQARAMHSVGISNAAIGRFFKVTAHCIQAIISGRSWSSVPRQELPEPPFKNVNQYSARKLHSHPK